MASMDYETENGGRYDDEAAPRYDRDRSASPRPSRRNDSPLGGNGARRSASPIGGDVDPRDAPNPDASAQDDGAINPGSNLFVTGIHPRLNEAEVTRLFEKYGDVEKCQIMLDPHTKESRGFGFVKMVTAEQADAAKEGLQGEMIEGRTLSIQKARRSRPRSPTPGKYFGPPKRDPRRGGGRLGGYDDRRRGGGGYGRDGYGGRDNWRDGGRDGGRDGYGGGRDRHRDDHQSYRGYRDDDRYGGRRDRERDDGYRSDRYGGGGGGAGWEDRPRYDDRRGGFGGDRYERGGGDRDRSDRGDRGDRDGPRPPRDAPPAASYGESAPRGEPREPAGGSGYDDQRYSRPEY